MAWRVIAASVQGAGHERIGLPCQDAVFWTLQSSSLLIAAIADGAGASARSDLAAQKAVKTVVNWITDILNPSQPLGEEEWKIVAYKALEETIKSIKMIANESATPLQEYATTLILTVATQNWIGVCQVGDGAVVIKQDNEGIKQLTRPVVGEYLNETVFITSEGALETAQTVLWYGRASHIAAFSDGLDLLGLQLPDYLPHEKFFDPLFRFAASDRSTEEQLGEFLRSPRVRERTDDDITLLLATWRDDSPCE